MAYTKRNPSPANRFIDTDLFQAFDNGIREGNMIAQHPIAHRLLWKIGHGEHDVNILVIGDSTSAGSATWPGLMAADVQALFPTHTVYLRLWQTATEVYDAGTQYGAAGSGARNINIWSAAVGGTGPSYQMARRFRKAILDPDPDLIIMSHGHNQQVTTDTLAAGQDMAPFASLTQSVSARLPEAQIILVIQNPRRTDQYTELHAETLTSLAAMQGYGLINLLPVFKADPDWETNLMLDDVHPNGVGQELIASTMLEIFEPREGMLSLPQKPSTLLTTGDNRIYNGRFDVWPDKSVAPTVWETSAGTIQEGSVAEKSLQSIRITSATGGNYQLMQIFNSDPDSLTYFRGRDMLLGARVWMDQSTDDQVHILFPFFRINSTYYNGAAISGQFQESEGWVWLLNTMKVPDVALTDFVIGLWAQVFSGTCDFTVDRVVLVDGSLPREWSPSPLDLWPGAMVRPISGNRGDVSVSLVHGDTPIQYFNSALTANRTVTLPAGRLLGQSWRLLRGSGATGAFTLAFDYGGLVGSALDQPAEWAEVTWNGTTYVASGGGVL